MTMRHWTLLAAVLASGWIAQSAWGDQPPPPVIPDTALEQPAKKTERKTTAKKTPPAKSTKSASEAAGPSISAGPAVVVAKDVNVRGQAAINSEVVAKLKKGEKVTVIEQVVKKPKPDEPAKWAKIAMPAGTPVWVNASFLDENRAVKPKKLNLRSGPGENYSIVGRLDKGAIVKEIETKGDWTKVEAPEGTYAFVAAHLLASEPAAPVMAAIPPPPVQTAVVTPPPTVVQVEPQPQPAPPVLEPVAPPAAPPALTVAAREPGQPIPQPILIEDPTIKRVVTREGIIRRSGSIQAPTYFVLESPINRKTINYIHSASPEIALNKFEGRRILVTGEELLDERWPNTPVLEVETLQAMP